METYYMKQEKLIVPVLVGPWAQYHHEKVVGHSPHHPEQLRVAHCHSLRPWDCCLHRLDLSITMSKVYVHFRRKNVQSSAFDHSAKNSKPVEAHSFIPLELTEKLFLTFWGWDSCLKVVVSKTLIYETTQILTGWQTMFGLLVSCDWQAGPYDSP